MIEFTLSFYPKIFFPSRFCFRFFVTNVYDIREFSAFFDIFRHFWQKKRKTKGVRLPLILRLKWIDSCAVVNCPSDVNWKLRFRELTTALSLLLIFTTTQRRALQFIERSENSRTQRVQFTERSENSLYNALSNRSMRMIFSSKFRSV